MLIELNYIKDLEDNRELWRSFHVSVLEFVLRDPSPKLIDYSNLSLWSEEWR